MRRWYEIQNAASDEAEILIYDVIGDSFWSDSVSAKQFVDDLSGISGDIHVRINSPGGDVFDGTAIYNALISHKGRVRTTVDGIAASMASVIAMAGETLTMPENAMMMIHDPWTMAVGNAAELRKTAEVLDKSKLGLVAAYQAKTGLPSDEISAIMAEETWFTGAEAVERGFADNLGEAVQIAATWSPKLNDSMPWLKHVKAEKTISLPSEPDARKVAVRRRRMMMAQ